MKNSSFRDSIYTRFLLQFLLLVFILIALVIFCLSFLNRQQNTQKYALNARVNRSVTTNISNNRQFVSQITQSLLSSSELISFLHNEYSTEKDYTTYMSSIQNYVQATINADPRSDIYIYMANPSIPMSMDVFFHLSDISDIAPVDAFLKSDDIDLWLCESDFPVSTNPYLCPVENRFVYLRKAYDYEKNFLGLLVFSIPEQYFLSFESDSDSSVLSEGHDRIINLTGEILPETLSFLPDDYSTLRAQQGSYLITWEYPEDFPFTVITVTKNTDYRYLLGGFFTLLCLFALSSLFLFFRSLRYLVQQVNQCLSAMDSSINNNYRTRVPVIGNNEISHICRRINLLLTQAAELSRQNILKETSNKQSQLIALQHQINPHFIYNTMEVFSSRMKLRGQYEESDAMVAFANIFRYNISTDNALVTLWEEIRQIKNYLHIQQLRYPHVTLENCIAETLYSARIPKFTLQPLVENAVSHGIIDADTSLVISLHASVKNDMMLFSITDNGSGVEPHLLDRINDELHADTSNHTVASDGLSVGLKNVNMRLKLFFGEASHLHLKNMPDHGTCVYFSIPHTFVLSPTDTASAHILPTHTDRFLP